MVTRKVKLADVLWDAANKHLAVNYMTTGQEYSCEAVARALGASFRDWEEFLDTHPAVAFLSELGCNPTSSGSFDRFQAIEKRQGVRYMWLLLAMHVAEDEDIEIEVNA